MRNIYIILLFLVCTECISQTNWFWQNPAPVGNHIFDSYFVDENIGYAVGMDGIIIKTTNGGENWTQQLSHTNRILTSVYFLNKDTGYITSGDEFSSVAVPAILLRTLDGGEIWETISSFSNTHLSTILFLNSNTGFMVGGSYNPGKYAYIFRTTNSGFNWTREILPVNGLRLYGITFINDSVGFTAGEGGRILKTANAGLNWDFMNTGGSGNYTEFRSIKFINSDTGIAVGFHVTPNNLGKIYISTDAGENWFQQYSGLNTMFNQVEFVDSKIGYIAAGESILNDKGKILKTTTSGFTWDTLSISDHNKLFSISIIASSKILGFGNLGTIIKSTDSGFSWNNISKSLIGSKTNLNKIRFSSSNTGYIVGDSGVILKTTDQGEIWIDTYYNDSADIKDINCMDNNTIYCIGKGFLKTTNGGSNWIKYPVSIDNLRSMDFVNVNTGFIVGTQNFSNYGKVFKTSNSGVNWVEVKSVTHTLSDCYFINENTGFVAGASVGSTTRVYRTTNSGISWQDLDLPGNYFIHSVYFVNDSVGVFAAYNGNLITNDYGETWNESILNVPYLYEVRSLYFANSTFGYMTSRSYYDYGSGGDLFKSTNGGYNWQRITSFQNYPTTQGRGGLNSIWFIDNNTGIMVGDRGAIYRTTNGGNTVGVVNINIQIPDKITLNQNYPNPFNPITKISFDLNKKGFVKLTIYNSIGQLVSRLVNETLNAGSYNYTFDGALLSSGLYFYRLETENKAFTKRMILTK